MTVVASRITGQSSVCSTHSVESPSTVDPKWDIWYWGSKWNLHTVCLSAVGCEWGTTSVYFWITYVCFIPGRLPVFAVEPQYLLQDFLFLSKVSFEGHIQNLQNISFWFKIWMGFVGPKLIKLWTSSIWGFLPLPLWWAHGNCLCKHAGHHSVTTGACSPPHLTCLGLCSMAAWKLNGPICAMCLFRLTTKTTNARVTGPFVRGIHRWPVDFLQKGQVTRKIFPFDDVIMW